jgi:hypothetical protein
VVLSRRRVWVPLMALVVGVMALGIVGVLRAVSASPDNKNHNTDSEERSTLTYLAKNPEARVVDLAPQGVSHGDVRALNVPLYNERGTKRIGRLDQFCVVTDPADESAEKAHMAECTKTFTLPGGEISVQGVIAYPKFSGIPPMGVDAISGGTGKYAGVQGEQHFETRGNRIMGNFHFID